MNENIVGGMESLFLDDASANADMLTFRNQLDLDFVSYEQRRLSTTTLMPEGSFVQRLKAGYPGSAGTYSHNLTCLRPERSIGSLERRHCFDRELMSLKLKRGRACKRRTALCSSDRCGLHVIDGVLTAAEAAALIAHGESVIRAEGELAYDAQYDPPLFPALLHSLTSRPSSHPCACPGIVPIDRTHRPYPSTVPIDRPLAVLCPHPAVQLALQARRFHAIRYQRLCVWSSAVATSRREVAPADGSGVWAASRAHGDGGDAAGAQADEDTTRRQGRGQ